MSWLSRLKQGLTKSSSSIAESVSSVVTKRKLDDEALEELEEALIAADLGVEAAAKLTTDLSKKRFDKDISDADIRRAMAESITEILTPVATPLTLSDAKPHVILVVGVNGNGKTTTIGKLAQQFHQQGKQVMLAACDTFRAAAVEQLSIWGERVSCPVITGAAQADPASVAYQALEQATQAGAEILLIDTAGRLHNKDALMDELAKIRRVLEKISPEAPHDTLLVLDATTGQNAHAQVDAFREKAGVTGLIVTKLDGSAKGGVVVALAQRFGLPIHAVGVGENVEDLHAFDPNAFATSLMGVEEK